MVSRQLYDGLSMSQYGANMVSISFYMVSGSVKYGFRRKIKVIMGIFDSFSINASGLTAERYRMDIIAENVANANTTRSADGTPYVRKVVTFEEKNDPHASFNSLLASNMSKYNRTNMAGVKVGGVYEDTVSEMHMVYDPAHPDADENGYVMYPNVNIITEMTNLISASRAYEANATAFNASKSMAAQGLSIGKS